MSNEVDFYEERKSQPASDFSDEQIQEKSGRLDMDEIHGAQNDIILHKSYQQNKRAKSAMKSSNIVKVGIYSKDEP